MFQIKINIALGGGGRRALYFSEPWERRRHNGRAPRIRANFSIRISHREQAVFSRHSRRCGPLSTDAGFSERGAFSPPVVFRITMFYYAREQRQARPLKSTKATYAYVGLCFLPVMLYYAPAAAPPWGVASVELPKPSFASRYV